MCPITSLFDLIEGPCKSIWSSPAEADLFSSAIFTCVCFDKFLYLCLFLSLWIFSSTFNMSKSRVKILGNPTTWVEDFPINHGK